MEVTSVTKSSDEIINELFTSLNVPLSPPLQTLDENVSITREALHSDTSNDNKEEGHSEDSITSGNETHGADRRRVKKSREKNTSDTDTKHRKKKKKRKKSHKKDDDYHKHKHKRKSKSKKKGDKEKSSTSVNETVCDDSLRDILDTAEIRISEDSTQKEKNSSIEKDSRTEVKSLLQKDKNSSVNKDRSKSRDRDRESSSKKNSSRHDLGWKKSTSTVNKRKRSRSPSPRSKTRTKDSVSRSSSRSRKRSKHSRSPVSESKQQKGRSWPSESLSRSPSSKKRLCSQSPTQEVRKENEDEQTCTLSTPKRLSEGEEGEGQESVIGKVSLDSIPLPLPAPLDIDPSSIPLPDTVSQPFLVVNKVEQLKTECENVVASSSVDSSNEKQSLETREDDTKKVKEEAGTDKNKSKVIVIKSLKDSIVFQLAQEEAERRAKERPQSSGEEETWEPNSSLEEEFDKLRSALCKVREEGEIVTSDEPEEEVKQEVEDKSKKLDKEEKKKRDKSKEKKTSKKKSSKKSKEKDKKKHKKEKEKKRKKKSRSSSRSRGRGRSKSEDAYYSKYRKRYSRSRSVSPYSRSRSPYERSRSRERKRNSHNDLRDKNARKRLLDIARRNAVYLVRHGCLPPSVEQEQLVKIQAGGKSVEELTDFCRQLVADGHYDELTDILSTEEEEKDEQAFSSSARHPFSIKDKPILMNIRNAPMLPTKTNKERLADNAMLRQQFPVSSGSQHRSKGRLWQRADNSCH